MDEQQFAQRLLALLQRNPNINVAEYFRNDPVFRDFQRITQFRHYRADEQQQILKLLIPALVEQLGTQCPALIESISTYCPSLIARKELFIPALIEKNQLEYGNTAVLFAKFSFKESVPEEDCRCKKYRPSNNGCVLTCDGTGMFDTPEECANINQQFQQPTTMYYHYAIGFGSLDPGYTDESVIQYGGSQNGWIFVGPSGEKIVSCQRRWFDGVTEIEHPIYESFYPNCTTGQGLSLASNPDFSRWIGESGARFRDSQIDVYYAGRFRYLGNMMMLDLTGYRSLGQDWPSVGMGGFKSVTYTYPQKPTDLGLANHYVWRWDAGDREAEVTNYNFYIMCQGNKFYPARNESGVGSLGRLRNWNRYGKITGYETRTITSVPASWPAPPWQDPTPSKYKYTYIQLYLGGDRREPLYLGEFKLDNAFIGPYGVFPEITSLGEDGHTPFTDNYWVNSSDATSNLYRNKLILDGDILLPSWVEKGETYGGSGVAQLTTKNTYEVNKLAVTEVFNTRGGSTRSSNWSSYFKAHVVKLSEEETEICIKHHVSRRFKRFHVDEYGYKSAVYDVIWCEITMVKIYRGSVSTRTYKFPEDVATDRRNWTSTWCKNWIHTENEYIGFSYGQIDINERGDSLIPDHPNTTGFWNHKLSYDNWPKLANGNDTLASLRYLCANLSWRKQNIGVQSPELDGYPVNHLAPLTIGTNFKALSDKLMMYEVKANQSFQFIKQISGVNKTLNILLPEMIKQQDVEAFVRYGEVEKLLPDHQNIYYWKEETYSWPRPHTVMYNNSNYNQYKTFQFKSSSIKVAKTKIFKIPEDSVILEISCYIDPLKLENSSSIIKPQIYESQFTYEERENTFVVEGVRRWLDNSVIPGIADIPDNYYSGSRIIDWALPNIAIPWNASPKTLTGCNETHTFQGDYTFQLDGNPHIKGYCEPS